MSTYAEGWAASVSLKNNFSRHFFRYLFLREGYKLQVYKDVYGYPTVGLGHLVQKADALSVGMWISPARVTQLFEADFKRLKIDQFINSCSWWDLPKQIAIASFIWTHGYGQYEGGQTERLLKDKSTTYAYFMDYLKLNWDKLKPVNQARNRADFDLFFTHTSILASGNFFWSQLRQDSYYTQAAKQLAELNTTAAATGGGSGGLNKPGYLGGALLALLLLPIFKN